MNAECGCDCEIVKLESNGAAVCCQCGQVIENSDEEEIPPMMLLSPDHPYIKGFFPWIVKCFWGKKRTYEVRYRDFDTVRQDIGFETLEEAIECVAKLKNDARKVYVWPSDYEELSRSWGSTETPKKAQGMQQ